MEFRRSRAKTPTIRTLTPNRRKKRTLDLYQHQLVKNSLKNTKETLDFDFLKNKDRIVPVSQMKQFEKILKDHKPQIVEFCLRKVQEKLQLNVNFNKVKQIDYSKKNQNPFEFFFQFFALKKNIFQNFP